MRRSKYTRRYSAVILYNDPWKVSASDLFGYESSSADFNFVSNPISLQPLGLLLNQAGGEVEIDLNIDFTWQYEYGGRRDSEGGLVPSYSRIYIDNISVIIKRLPKSVDPNLFVSGISKFLKIVNTAKEMMDYPGFANILRLPELKNFIATDIVIPVDFLKSKAYMSGIIAELKDVVDIDASDLFKVVDNGDGYYDLLITSKKYLGMIHDDIRVSENMNYD